MHDDKEKTEKKPYHRPTVTDHGRVMDTTLGLARWQIEGPAGWQAKDHE